MTSLKRRTILFTSLLLVLLSWILVAGARDEIETKPVPAGSAAPSTEHAGISNVAPTTTCTQPAKSLKLHVDLFPPRRTSAAERSWPNPFAEAVAEPRDGMGR